MTSLPQNDMTLQDTLIDRYRLLYSTDIITCVGGPSLQHEVLQALRTAMVLDDLADV